MSTERLLIESLPLGVVAFGGVSVLAFLVLAVTRFDTGVFVGAALLGVVLVEPAPVDVVFMLLIAVAAATGRLRFDHVPFPVLGLILLFLAINLVSSTGVLDVPLAAKFFAITTYLLIFAAWLADYARSPARVRVFILGYLLAAVVGSTMACLATFTSFPGSELMTYQDARAQGLFKDPNVFGPFLVLPLLVLIEELFAPRLLRLGVPAKLAGISVLGLGVLLSYSRAAWLNAAIALGVLVLVYLLRRQGLRRAFVLLAVFLLAGSVLVSAATLSGSGAFIQQRASGQNYDVDRFEAQRTGISLVAQQPLGIGPGQFDVVVPTAAHSLYVRTLAEQGVLGLVTLVLLVALTLFLAVSAALRGHDTHGLGSAALLAAWCGLLANSLFVDTIHWRHLWIVAALIWAGASAPRRRRQQASRSGVESPGPAQWV